MRSSISADAEPPGSGNPAAGRPEAPLASWIGAIGLRLALWRKAYADAWMAAALYERLSALSDADLARRGLSRSTLTLHVRAACERDAQQ